MATRARIPIATCAASVPARPVTKQAPVAEQAVGGLPILGQKPLHPERAELVGRYALQIYWSDGHSTGIYSFPYLRSLCPCPECTAAARGRRKRTIEVVPPDGIEFLTVAGFRAPTPTQHPEGLTWRAGLFVCCLPQGHS